MRRNALQLVVQPLAGLADRSVDTRREPQVDERRTQVEAAAADEDRGPARARSSSIAACASAAYSPTAPTWSSGQMPTSRCGAASRSSSESAGRSGSAARVQAHRVGGDDLAADALGERDRSRGLARGRWPEEGDDRGTATRVAATGAAQRSVIDVTTRPAPCGTCRARPAPGRSRSCSLRVLPAHASRIGARRALDQHLDIACRRARGCAASACAWIRSTSRSSRSCLTSSGTWSPCAPASVPRRGE